LRDGAFPTPGHAAIMASMLLLIDNYDSFTYNLVQRIGELDPAIDLRVFRNDKITVEQARALQPDHLIISPGPCSPTEAGVSCQIVEAFAGTVPLLGVCLGHQSIGHATGMTVHRHDRLMHGKTSEIHHDGRTIFAGLANPFTATRYHSLIIDPQSFDHDRFELTAWTETEEIMGFRAKPGIFGEAPLEGVQFHPESFLTEEGPKLLANFLDLPWPSSDPETTAA
jgi:anthranilate synthase/aminodeoxychorismate synthase-like glutamine amidotransferase